MPAVIWTALLFALQTRGAAGVTSELRLGRAPVSWGQPSENTVAWTTVPSLSLFAFDPVKSLSLSYTPRILLREPNIERRLRAIVLHQATLQGFARFSPAVTGSLAATGAVGELDYSAWQQVLGNTGPNVPRTNRLAQAGGQARLDIKASRTITIENEARAFVWAPLSTQTQATEQPIPGQTSFVLARQTTLGLQPSLIKQISRRNRANAAVDGAYYQSTAGLRVFTITPSLGFAHSFAAQGTASASFGLTIARDLSAATPGTPDESRVVPASNLRVASLLTGGSGGRRLEGEFGASTAYFVDPVLGRGRLRGTALVRFRAVFSPHWNAALEANFSTSLMKNPLLLSTVPTVDPITQQTLATQYPYETQLLALLPVRWQPSPAYTVEMGLRYTERGPHLRAPGFSLRERETWGYVLGTALFDFGGHAPATTPTAAPTTPTSR